MRLTLVLKSGKAVVQRAFILSAALAASFSVGIGETLSRPAAESHNMIKTLPYGSWPSPISAASVVEGSRGLGSLNFDGGQLYWVCLLYTSPSPRDS